MKKLLFFIIALFVVLLSGAQQSIVIKGKIDNYTDRNRSSIQKYWFNPEKLQEESKSTDFPIEEDGTFSIKIQDADEFYVRYWIHLGNEYTHLDLIAGDSIYMTLNALMFDESIQYTGRGAGRNNYRRDVFLKFWDTNSTSKLNTKDPSQFLNELTSLTESKLELLNKYYLAKKIPSSQYQYERENGPVFNRPLWEIDSSYYKYERGLILNEKANQILINHYNYYNHKYLPDSLSHQMAAILKTADFSDDHYLNHKEFRDLITDLPRYTVELNPIKPGVDLNHQIQFAREHYTETMQLYFNKEIIRKYVGRAQNMSEKHALLDFFNNQFHAPVLKREIQLQKNIIQTKRFANSRIFQASLISIFWFVVLVLLLLAIVKLIQLSRENRMKINLALWLKVIFYLGVSLAAFIFIAISNLHEIPFLLLLLGTFLIHTYVLIPKYALKKGTHYAILLGVALIVFVAGVFITIRIWGSNYPLFVFIFSDLFFGLVLLSWISYYIDQLASRKSTLKDLIKSGDLNREIAFHLVALFLINTVFIAGHDGSLNPMLLFYSILLLFYFHTFFTFPRFFNKKRAIQFIGINVLILLIASMVMITMDAVQSYEALKNIGIETKLSELFSVKNIRLDLLFVFSLLLIPSFVYYFIKKQLMNNESTGFKLYRKKEAELAQLRSQVNPHFLFNTLNTLYAFALKEGSEKTAECIAKLANLMRFMLDDMEKDSILLKREISYIKDYVKLQSIRSAVEHDIDITVDLEDEEGYSIAPMLLIPFVENAFKHGMNPNKVSQLKIDVHAKGNQIQFVIENSIDDNFEAYYKEKGFGIGIENVKSRLKHIYPDRHTISIAKTNAKFIVILTIGLV